MEHIRRIRNFSIIAHIDHGKSTLADRLLEVTKTLTRRELREQVLDDMDLERERGITIKAHPIQMEYTAKDNKTYILNLIDTPGHVDFSYEVSRSLSACEAALLLVDASQGVEAQTLSNIYLALKSDIEIIPVLNKIDLPNADIDSARHQLINLLGVKEDEILLVSAKTGEGVEAILDRIVSDCPMPIKPTDEVEDVVKQPLKALIFDSFFDNYRGVVVYIRIFQGRIHKGMRIRLMASQSIYDVSEVGILKLKLSAQDELVSGDVGYFIANIKSAEDVHIGDTVTEDKRPATDALSGFTEMHPMVYCGLYPLSLDDFEPLKKAIQKLKLNDASFNVEPEDSVALGYGFRCGFLGLLHMEIIQERLEREFNIPLIATAPSVVYNVHLKSGEELTVDNPVRMPPQNDILYIEEPIVRAYIITPVAYIGPVMQLAVDFRGSNSKTESLDQDRIIMSFDFPLSEILTDFYDKLKSVTRGYASLDYEHKNYQKSNIVRLDMTLNEDPIDAFSMLIHKSRAESKGRALAKKLKEVLPQHLFRIAVQAAVNNKVIARETVSALKKNVTAKCYGGDITRKRKLWDKQKEGKKKMKQIGKVQIPHKAFFEVLKSS